MPTRLVLLVLSLAVSAALVASPASARPGRVSTPYVSASTTHSMTLRWSAHGTASRYEVSVSRTKAGAAGSSARTKRTHGRSATLTMGGLGAGKAYCFTVRALSGSSAGPRSPVHCHLTMRHAILKHATKVTVATYNICSFAKGCAATWRKRARAVVKRIVSADADVVALQETGHRATELRRALKPYGYKSEGGGTEMVFYRSALFSRAFEMRTFTDCARERYTGPSSTTDWDKSRRHYDDATERWYVYDVPFWVTEDEICHDHDEKVLIGKGVGVGGCPVLVLRATGRRTAFCSVHLTAGTAAKNSRIRKVETRSMLRKLVTTVDGNPAVIAGDFNSDRGRPDDSPRKVLAKAGWFDAYDRSSTYTRPWLNSFNGFRSTPRRSKTWGGHIDRIFIRSSMGSSGWAVDANLRHGRYAGTKPSDHNLVRTTVHLP